jgi:hypothetical protein
VLSIRRRRRSIRGELSLESLEQRALLSATSGALYPLALLPNESTISSPRFSDQWYLQNTGQTLSSHPSGPATGTPGADIGAVKAWNLTTGSRNVVVAVFDTGVDLTHPDLVNNIWHNDREIAGNGLDDDHNGFVDDTTGWNFVDGNNDVSDTSFTDHGTLVSGVIAAEGNNGQGIAGTNWHVSILPVKVGTDLGVSSSALQAGISYVEALKARGVNIVAINASYISFGIPSLGDISAISTTANYGILYVSAAGNSSMNFDSFIPSGFLPSSMMLVAATDNQDHLASFSNYGSGSVAIGAPGVDILSTMRGGGYGMFSGTSFAGPMVSGTAALLKALVPGASMEQIKNAILAGGTPDPYLVGKTITGRRLSAYGALETLVGNQRPVGHVDALSRSGISGWAYDFNAGVQPVAVAVVADGKFLAATTANINRADLGTAFGSPGHAFNFGSSIFDALGGGNHTIQVYAIDLPGLGPTLSPALLASGTITGPQAPAGRIERVTATTVSGWAIDLDTLGTGVSLRIDVDGETAGTATANVPRADLQKAFGSANHGFVFTLPTALSQGFHRVDLYAHDTTTNALTYLGSKEVNTNTPPRGSVDVFTGTSLKGWAFDDNATGSHVQIRYQVDGNAPVIVSADQNRADLQNVLGSSDHAFDITLPQLPAGMHTVIVWAADPATHNLVLLGVKSATASDPAGNRLPYGRVDVATTTRVAGWAYDPTTPFHSIEVRVDVDGAEGTPFGASKVRNDLTPTLHGPAFGFDVPLSLSPGRHRVDVYAIDAPGGTAVLLGSRLVGNVAPAGTLATASGTAVTGTAILPATPDVAAQVLLAINNVPAVEGTADDGGNYSIALPKLMPGSYTLSVYAIDPGTLTAVLLGSKPVRITTLG